MKRTRLFIRVVDGKAREEKLRPVDSKLPHAPKSRFLSDLKASRKAPQQTPEEVMRYLAAAQEKREQRAAKRRAQKERA